MNLLFFLLLQQRQGGTPPPPPAPAPAPAMARPSDWVMSSGDFVTLIAAKRQERENDIDDETVCLLASAIL